MSAGEKQFDDSNYCDYKNHLPEHDYKPTHLIDAQKPEGQTKMLQNKVMKHEFSTDL